MRRFSPSKVPVLRILVHNWPIKLFSLTASLALYTGLVFSGAFLDDVWRGVPAQFVEQGESFILAPAQPPTVDVEYRIARDSDAVVNADSFIASIDLTRYDRDEMGQPQVLPIRVIAPDDGIEVLAFAPATVTVTLDSLAERSVSVFIDYGSVPAGVEIGDVEIDTRTVEIRGPASAVDRVDRALGRVQIDPSGIDINRQVELEAVDVAGERVENVEVSPSEVGVTIGVTTVETNITVPVRPDIVGVPAAGFALENLVVAPSIVTLRGDPSLLAEIDEVLTEPIDIAGSNDDFETVADLLLPDGARLADPSFETTVTVSASFGPSAVGRTFLVGVTCTGAGTSSCIPSIDQMTVTLSGPAATLRQLEAADVTPLLDVSGLGAGEHSVTPSLAALPDGVEVVAISPGRVVVTITPSAPPPTPAPSEPPATPTPTPTPTPAPSEPPAGA